MKIEWKPIAIAPGYSVSNTGLVRSEHRVITMSNGRKRTIAEKILPLYKTPKGYIYVHLGATKKAYVHRLVAQAFLGDPKPGYEANHKDENKENNCVSNLEWVTKDYNLRYGTRVARSHSGNRKYYRPVIALKDGEAVFHFFSLHEAERAGFSRFHVSNCCNGKAKTHKGFTWAWGHNKELTEGMNEK